MSSLKVFISSSVYVTIDPLLLLLFLVELCLAIFWAVFRICSSVQNKEEPPGHFKKTLLFVFNPSKGDNGFENIVK